MVDEVRVTVNKDVGSRVVVSAQEVPYVVRTKGAQGVPGVSGTDKLLELTDVIGGSNPSLVPDGALLIYDLSQQAFRLLTDVEQGQCINGGYF